MRQLAIIGGTGVSDFDGMELTGEHNPETAYGEASRPIQEGLLGKVRVYFLQRHGSPNAIPPHRINYRANLWALRSLGATDIVAINAVGGIAPHMPSGVLVIPDQVIDYTWGREHSVDDGSSGQLQHIDFTEPYDRGLRQALIAQARGAGIAHQDGAVHGVTQGPRLESAAEVRRMTQDGCDVVGMTGMPEAALAMEMGLAYASLCMVVNPAAGLGDEPLSLEMMREALEREAAVVRELLLRLIRADYCG